MVELLPQLLEGAVTTVEITVLASALGIVLGVAAGLARLSPRAWLRAVAGLYVETFRGTSALVQLFWLFFVLPYFGITLAPMTVAVIGLALNTGAYGAEVVRSAVVAVPGGQYEAATALNMTRTQALWHIVLPQAAITMVPPWGNLFIELLKATSLVSLITISDLTFKAVQLNQTTFRPVEIFTLVLLIYLAISLVLTTLVRASEYWLRRSLLGGEGRL